MRRWRLPVLSLILLLTAVALGGCGGGGSAFEFTGTWMFHETVTQNTGIAGFPVGGTTSEVITLAQNGNSITLTTPPPATGGNGTVLIGTCNADAKTFNIDYVVGGVRFVINGIASGDNVMNGDINLAAGGQFVKLLYTADRL